MFDQPKGEMPRESNRLKADSRQGNRMGCEKLGKKIVMVIYTNFSSVCAV
jgi:hypothetical protein